MTKAWMLRQDGKYWEIVNHLYAMNDDNLASEAEVASFLLYTDSKDKDLCYLILDAWMAMLIEDSVLYDSDSEEIDDFIVKSINSLPYKFPYDVNSDLIDIHHKCNNYSDTGQLYDFIDDIRERLPQLQQDIQRSLNQQFCRVRAGGKLSNENETAGNNSLWFRISSAGFNWSNTIYEFVVDHYRGLHTDYIYICRDYESDNGDDYSQEEYFYKANDGTPYYNMPVSEYLAEEHESNPVFSSYIVNSGVIKTVKQMLSDGYTYCDAINYLDQNDIVCEKDIFTSIISSEKRLHCIEESYLTDQPTRTQTKLRKVLSKIMSLYPEIEDIDIVDEIPRANSKGNMTACELMFEIKSYKAELNDLQLGIILMRGLSDATPDVIVRGFRQEYEFYKKSKGIK